MFSNIIDIEIMSSNSTVIISDQLPQFTVIFNKFPNTVSNESNIYERDFDWENFVLDFFLLKENLLKIDELNVDKSTQVYSGKINILLDTYAPL